MYIKPSFETDRFLRNSIGIFIIMLIVAAVCCAAYFIIYRLFINRALRDDKAKKLPPPNKVILVIGICLICATLVSTITTGFYVYDGSGEYIPTPPKYKFLYSDTPSAANILLYEKLLEDTEWRETYGYTLEVYTKDGFEVSVLKSEDHKFGLSLGAIVRVAYLGELPEINADEHLDMDHSFLWRAYDNDYTGYGGGGAFSLPRYYNIGYEGEISVKLHYALRIVTDKQNPPEPFAEFTYTLELIG